jgi:hypothetical protein
MPAIPGETIVQHENESNHAVPAVASALGRAGLIPFVALPLLMLGLPGAGALWSEALGNYALAITCFLPGAWWGLSLIRRSASALLLSNALVIIAFAGRTLLDPRGFFLLAAVLLVTTLAVERRHPMFGPQPTYYARLRLQLTVVACIGLGVAAAL